MIALLCMVTQGAWADVTTVYIDGVFTGFTATSGSAGISGDVNYDKLVDGSTNTKWRTNSNPFYVEFHSSGLIVPTGYIMTTADDASSQDFRNPKSWIIKAKVNAGDEWTTLVTETNNTSLPAANTTPVEFSIPGNTTAYQYFRLEVSETVSSTNYIVQLAEFQFKGTTTDTDNINIITPLSGSGTSENPYTISSVNDWNSFAYYVSSGTNNYSGKYVRLDANISVSEMVGLNDVNSFRGTFLGNGKTLTFTKGSSESKFNEEYCAPFRYTNGATITNLKVTGDIYTERKFGAGLIARPNGITTITDCYVSTVIHSHVSGDGTHGGYLAYPQGNVNFSDCVYTGRLFTTNGTTKCGGFVGWHNDKTYTIINSFYAPNPSTMPTANESAITDESATFVRGTTVNAGCYYTETMGTEQGTQAYTSAFDNEINKQIPINTTTYYLPCSVSGVDNQYLYTGSAITVTPTITYGNTVLTEGTDYTVSISPATVREKADYTMTITSAGTWLGSKTIQFEVTDGTPVTSETTTMPNGSVYLVDQDVTINSRITINGKVTLVLGEGKTLTAPKGIELASNNNANLTIDGTGTLTINGCDEDKSGIGANEVGTLTINGGTINVTGGNYGAGIGGNKNNTVGGTITINGGVVNAHGGDNAAGIGGGLDLWTGHYSHCGDIIINGGQVTAIGGSDAAGIGPGFEQSDESGFYNSGTLTINWTSPEDFIYTNRLHSAWGGSTLNSITFPEDRAFVLEGSVTPATASNMAGKKIVPNYHDGNYALTDGNAYPVEALLLVTSATYTKTIAEGRENKFHSWFVPFDHTITAADLEKFTFYKINMIANSPDPSQEASDQMWVFVKKLQNGDVLHANMPYVYKPKEAVTNYVFTSDSNKLMPKPDGPVATLMTMEDIYTIYASYDETTATAQDPFYYVAIDGTVCFGNNVTLGSFRWFIRKTNKYGETPVYAPEMYFFDGEETTNIMTTDFTDSTDSDAWYDMQGRKLEGKPTAKGLYIHNGRKVVVQ